MPYYERNKGCQSHNHEEWQAGNTGSLPCLRHKNVQDRQELGLIIELSVSKEAGIIP